ncbi:MAG: ribonuclease HI [Thiotrichales bacterium]|nr:ribonuclease HI [Thiotrichales bacterium]
MNLTRKQPPEQIQPNTSLDVFSDGGYVSKLHIGGWGVVVIESNQSTYTDSGACRTQSSLEMELLAAVNALEAAKVALKPNQNIVLHTDSRILIEGLDGKIERYKQQNWHHLSGRPVESRELWERFETLTRALNARVEWVKGHNGNPGNQMADQLARQAIETYLDELHPH